MSTNSECEFIEVEPGEWYYVLEHIHAPKNAWDWREFASACGPFATLDLAREHLRTHHANPGGYSTQEYVDGFTPDEVLAELLKEARR